MSTHMHGPWRVSAVSEISIVDFGGNDVAIVCGDYDIDYERMAYQARLIAAAPDMAEALQLAALSLDDMEKTNAMLNRDVMAATCLVISNEIRNVLIKAGVSVPPVKAGL